MNIHRCARTCAAGRALLVDRVMQQGWSVEAAAAAAGISKRTVYKWVKRFTDEGADGLLDRSSRPHRSPTRLQLEKADIVLELRRTRRMTAAKIAAVLHLARSTVARLLQREGIGRLRLLDPKRTALIRVAAARRHAARRHEEPGSHRPPRSPDPRRFGEQIPRHWLGVRARRDRRPHPARLR